MSLISAVFVKKKIFDRVEEKLQYRDKKTREIVTRLRSVTSACREDMHEPDEQGVYAKVQGNHLDNAMGSTPEQNCGEIVVLVGNENSGQKEWFNLADLLAIVRRFPV